MSGITTVEDSGASRIRCNLGDSPEPTLRLGGGKGVSLCDVSAFDGMTGVTPVGCATDRSDSE